LHKTFKSSFAIRFWLNIPFTTFKQGEIPQRFLSPALYYCCPLLSSHSSESTKLTPKSEEEWPFLLHAQFTPRGHSLVMVFNYDIYYKTGPKSAQSYRITKTAMQGLIHNGVPDWLYEGSL